MSQRYREYKRRKKRQNMINDVIAYVMIIVICLIFAYGILERAVTLRQINAGSLQEYTGTYEFTKIRGNRKSKAKYIFALDNGNVLTVRASVCENEELLNQYGVLTFQYSDIPSNPFTGRFTAQSITTPNGDEIIRDINSAKRGNINGIWIFSIFLFFLLSLLLVPYVLCHAEKWLRQYQKRNQKNCK